jgi:hypothetical protein
VAGRPAESADDLTVWLGGLRWVVGAWMQTTRLTDVVHAWDAALADARLRAHLNEDIDHARSWRESYDAHQPYDPQRPIRVPTLAVNVQLSIEFEFSYRRPQCAASSGASAGGLATSDDRPAAVTSDAEHRGALG